MYRIFPLYIVIILLAVSELRAQPFETVSSSITGVGRSTVAWGDYDVDGDLDLIISGMTNSGSYLSRIYENDSGTFIINQSELQGVKDGSVAWGDFDNDNDLDVLLTGETEGNGNISLIYRNDDGVFTEYDAGLPEVGYGDASWGDFDNDGDLDIMITGSWAVALYENVDGIFTDTENDFGNLQNAKTTWGDFDNDGDLDILLIGDTGGGYFADIYLNHDGSYMAANLGMEGVFSGSADMIDYDNDGDLDISLTGFNIYLDPCFFIYENLGDGTISQHFTSMEGIATSTVDWGDYDNDGDLDVLMAGKNAACGASIAKVYNNEEGVFMMENGAIMDGAIRCNAAWADFDNDGDLDYILSGMTLSEYPFTILYRNEAGTNEYKANTLPEPPAGADAIVDHQSVTLSWQKAADAETPQDGLYYNIRLGLHSGEHEIVTPMSDSEGGYRLIPAIGNASMQTAWTISGLQAGTYYWSVQTIDQAYAGSEFAEEGTFQIIETGIAEQSDGVFSIYPNPAQDRIYVQFENAGEYMVSILNTSGQIVHSLMISSGDVLDISFLKKGIYFLHAIKETDISIQRFVKQ